MRHGTFEVTHSAGRHLWNTLTSPRKIARMNRREPDSKGFNLLRLLDEYARAAGVPLRDSSTMSGLLERLRGQVECHRANPALVHGMRTELMFAYVAAGLGRCQAIQQEDSGEFFCRNSALSRPDYRIVLDSGRQCLVEVKNFHPRDATRPFSLKSDYYRSLASYGAMMSIPVLLAVYWTRQRVWTLTDLRAIRPAGSRHVLSFESALMTNEMCELGDVMVGVEAPLTLRLFSAARSWSREVGPGFSFTIAKAEHLVNGRTITDPIEQQIHFFLCLFGSWEEKDPAPAFTDDDLAYVDLDVAPIETGGEQNFDLVGFLSQMLSTRYLLETSEARGKEHLLPTAAPSAFSVPIPPGYAGTVLKLWQLQVQPNFEGSGFSK